jgi:hypothetical protein
MKNQKSDRTIAIDQAVTRAHRRADETGLVYAVVEIDHDAEDRRVVQVVLQSATWDDEFEAFGGVVLYSTDQHWELGDDHE